MINNSTAKNDDVKKNEELSEKQQKKSDKVLV